VKEFWKLVNISRSYGWNMLA